MRLYMSGGIDNRYDKICALPWKHLATHPHGGCTLCCISDHRQGASRARNFVDDKVEWLSLNSNSIDEIMNSDFYRSVRLQMLNGQEPDACKRCYDEERAGLRSKRLEENERYYTDDFQEFTGREGEIIPNFEFIELRLGNVCNLRCRTCNPASSTKWIRDYKHLETKLSFVTKYGEVERGTWYESETFWDDLLQHSKNIKRIYINGGEPTLIKKHFYYLQKLIDSGLNENIELWYNLNLTNVDDELLEYWKKFRKCAISASIDDLGVNNEYIRTGSDWENTINNLRKLKSLGWIDLSVVQTVSLYNIENIDKFYDFIVFQENIPIHINWVYDPEFQQAWHLEDEKKQEVILKCKNVMHSWDFENVFQHLNKPRDLIMYNRFIEFNKTLDEISL